MDDKNAECLGILNSFPLTYADQSGDTSSYFLEKVMYVCTLHLLSIFIRS